MRDRANREEWTKAVAAARKKAIEKTLNKTAEAAANNAAKLQRARGLAIDRLIRALETMPENGGGRVRQQQNDKKSGKQITVDYDLPALVAALEKLSEGSLAMEERQERIADDTHGVMISYAELFSRAAPERTISSINAGDDAEDEGGECDV